MKYDSVLETIGNTPLVKIKSPGGHAEIMAKLEYFNPMGSVKDRPALAMIEDAEKKGKIKPGDLIVEPTSGNTGIGLALAAAVKKYRLVLTMPETMSVERRKLLKIMGAEIILTDGAKGMKGAVEEAERIAEKEKAFLPQQFENKSNAEIHYRTTGPEIWKDTEGKVDVLVAGVGTGGTITGTGKYLKEKSGGKVKVVAVEPSGSPVLSGGKPGPHQIQGIGAGFVPEVLDKSLIDEVIRVEARAAYETARVLAKNEGILCGISSGANMWAAVKIAEKEENKGKIIVVIIPDTGERYLSTELFASEE